MRRVAIASVLSMRPQALILDEPTTGLDAQGKEEIFKSIKYLKEEENITVLLVSHDMNEVASIAERIVIINQGKIVLDDVHAKIFTHAEELIRIGVGIPQIASLVIELSKIGLELPLEICDVEEAKVALLRHFHKVNGC